jgi:hypothetical protein
MTRHLDGDPIFFMEYDIWIPDTNEKAVKGAVLRPGGDEQYIQSQLHRYEVKNRVKAAAAAATAETARLREFENEIAGVNRKLRWIGPSLAVKTVEAGARVRWFHVAGATMLALVALGAVVVSNVVLSTYVLSSSSDWFANNHLAATLYASMPFLGALAVKIFEQRLRSDQARQWYGRIFYAVGITSLCIWIAATAVAFAPEIKESTILLPASYEVTGALSTLIVATTIVCDVTFGFLVLSGAGQLLSVRRSMRTVSNPSHGSLLKRKARLEAKVEECRRNLCVVEDYLARAAAGRALTRELAEFDLNRVRELWVQAQSMAIASAIGCFLNPEG